MKYALLMYLHKIINTRMKHGLKKRRFLKKQEKTNIIGNKCFRSVI